MGGWTESSGAYGYTLAAVLVAFAGCREEPSHVQGAPVEAPPATQDAPEPPRAAPPADPTAASDAPAPATAASPPASAAPRATSSVPRRATAPTAAPVKASPAPLATPAPSPSPSPPSSPPPGATTDPRFVVWMQPSGGYRTGEQGSVEVVLSCKGEWHCNEKYPTKFTLDAPPAGVSYPQPVVRRDAMSISAQRAMARVPFVASSSGPVKVSGKLSFSVCTETQCVVETRPLAATVSVQ